jgi:LysM repeat protein
MSNKKTADNVIQSYRRRQQMGPFIIGGLAVLLVVVGILVLIFWLTGPNRPGIIAQEPSATTTATMPLPTSTASPSPIPPTSTFTVTSTITLTSTVTTTSTPTGPFEYEVKEGDTCYTIAQTYKANLDVLVALNPAYGPNCNIKPGDKLLIPTPNQQLPTSTPVPTNLAPGTIIEVTVKTGDTVRGLALLYHSTEAAIVKANNLANANSINVGQVLKIPVNIATPVPTTVPSRTLTVGTPQATSTATTKP